MILVGLTGGIGSGKSTVTSYLRQKEIAVFDADACVYQLYENEAVPLIEEAFPGSIVSGKVVRPRLSKILAGKDSAFKKLEAIIHPLVNLKKIDFLKQNLAQKKHFCFFDIPLLFETSAQSLFDLVVVISVNEEIQRQRVLARPNMNAEKFNDILKRQLSLQEKIALADYVIENNEDLEELYQKIDELLAELEAGKWQAEAVKNWDI